MGFLKKGSLLLGLGFLFTFGNPAPSHAMHIMEGVLPLYWALFWWAVTIPFLAYSIYAIKKVVQDDPSLKMLLGVCGAFTFVLSALKLPSVTGSSSHPTGVGLGAVMFGPAPMTLLGTIVLLFQATLLAHGGLTTLGANAFSMAIVGPFVAYGVYKFGNKLSISHKISLFFAAFFADLVTYLTTSLQLAMVFPGETGLVNAFLKFASVFAVTQIPLAIVEGIITVLVFNFLWSFDKETISKLKFLPVRCKENGTTI